jgi:hypothetical protein
VDATPNPRGRRPHLQRNVSSPMEVASLRPRRDLRSRLFHPSCGRDAKSAGSATPPPTECLISDGGGLAEAATGPAVPPFSSVLWTRGPNPRGRRPHLQRNVSSPMEVASLRPRRDLRSRLGPPSCGRDVHPRGVGDPASNGAWIRAAPRASATPSLRRPRRRRPWLWR